MEPNGMEHLTDHQIVAIRMQSVMGTELFDLLEHAASCQHCSERVISLEQMRWEMVGLESLMQGTVLHLTVDDVTGFVDRSLPGSALEDVNAHLAVCQECTREVENLQRLAESGTEAKPSPSWDLRAYVASLLRPQWPMVATVLILLVGGSVAFWQQRAKVQVQVAERRHQEEARVTSQAGTAREPMPRSAASAGTTAPEVRTGHSLALAFVLTPGVARGVTREQVLSIPLEAETVELSLRLRSVMIPGQYSVSIAEQSGHLVWKKDMTFRKVPAIVVVHVPAANFHPAQYVLTLDSANAETAELLEDYVFRVTR